MNTDKIKTGKVLRIAEDWSAIVVEGERVVELDGGKEKIKAFLLPRSELFPHVSDPDPLETRRNLMLIIAEKFGRH